MGASSSRWGGLPKQWVLSLALGLGCTPSLHVTGREVCNGIDDDHDGEVDEGFDADGDGFLPCPVEGRPQDCDDQRSAVHPGAREVCDGVDTDCSGDLPLWEQDRDGDGVRECEGDCNDLDAGVVPLDRDGDGTHGCSPIPDCDDTDPLRAPSLPERCNGVDDNCDGYVPVDELDADGDGQTVCGGDCDDLDASRTTLDLDGDGVTTCAGLPDCDDTDPAASYAQVWYLDLDGDGYGESSSSRDACRAPAGYSSVGGDCNDADPTEHPGAAEVCDQADDDCDGRIDEGLALSWWYADTDVDGYGDADDRVERCDGPDGRVADATDCDDTDAAVFPGATEWCNSIDDDCDGTVDEDDATDASTWYPDADSDGFGALAGARLACVAPAAHISDSADCDDTDPTVFPAADEWCNGIDDDCDGVVDESEALDAERYYPDLDLDGWGDQTTPATLGCSPPSGLVAETTLGDCNDADATIHPGAAELCNDIDDNCDGGIDNDAGTIFYEDDDGDGWGSDDTGGWERECTRPSGYVAVGGDCDDDASGIHPGATEVCDGDDEDCDGLIDEADAADATTWYPDADSDGAGDDSAPLVSCSEPSGMIELGGDCDDTDPAVGPFATEVCDNGQDDDCDGTANECTPVGAVDVAAADWTVLGEAGAPQVGRGLAVLDIDADGATDLVAGMPGIPGAAVFLGPLSSLSVLGTDSADWSLAGDADSVNLGESAAALDLDGDGFSELMLGDPDADGSGSVWIYGGPVTAAVTADAAVVGDAVADGFGAVVLASDLDGDGVDDLLVSGPGVDSAAINSGSVYMVFGVSTGSTLASTWSSLDGPGLGAEAGTGVVAADVNGDGFEDVLVGAPSASSGVVGVFLGPMSASRSWSSADGVISGAGSTALGSALAAGDLDGDGWQDAILGAPAAALAGTDAGTVYVLSGSILLSSGLGSALARVDGVAGDLAGFAVTAADLDTDGQADLIVGAPGRTAGGAVWIEYGPLSGVLSGASPAATVSGAGAGAELGARLQREDTDSDGIDEVWMAAPGSAMGGPDGGAWFGLSGGAW